MTAPDPTKGTPVARPDPRDPTDAFLRDVADIRLKAAGRDAVMLRLGAVAMPAGVVIAVLAWFTSHNSTNPLDQRDAMVLALVGVTVSLVGVGLFLRYSLAEFLRFWLARMIHHQQQTADTNQPPTKPSRPLKENPKR